MSQSNSSEETELETRSKEDVNALINEMEGEDFDPSEVVKSTQQQTKEQAEIAAYQAKLALAREGAFKGVAGLDWLLKMADARLGLSDMQGEVLTEAAAPVLVKYTIEPPEWYKQWGPEMQLAGALCFVGVMQYKTLVELRKLDAEKARQLAREKEAKHGAD